ncbi:amidohydrolase [Chromobacterium haemolyticum]|uniref:Amidohydrolase n=1 Tax=Chromobacterium fluminis TaxID=3044269 RepID=A0ABX0LCG7_9NEIS|nr:amidohydrolase family protein [Chromobacterium haemolyticum]NHR06958.1 amidohydrolase [Chromobacterium haemolyticum]
MTEKHNLGSAYRLKQLVSSDSHIIEPPDLWTKRIDARYRDVAPRVVRIDGSDWWQFDGRRIGSVSGRKKRSGSIALEASTIPSRGAVLTHSTFDQVDPAAYVPSEYVKSNLADGICAAIIRPTQGITNYCINDAGLFGAICRAYNDWIVEFCSENTRMLKAVAMLNNYDPKDAVAELYRARKRGMVGGIISVYPGEEHSYAKPEYEPLWSAAEELGMPLSLHVLTNHNGPYGVPFPEVNYSLRVNAEYWVRMSLADMIFGGVFERHPTLRIESSEHEAAWVPYFLWQMDWTYERRIRQRMQGACIKERPSYYFSRNVWISLIYDDLAIAARHEIGVGKLMWGSDFPHEQSTNPRSLDFVNELLEGVPLAEAQAIVHDNAVKMFGLDIPLLAGLEPQARVSFDKVGNPC